MIRKYAVNIVIFMMCIVTLYMREYLWYSRITATQLQTEFQGKITVKEPVKVTISNCIISDSGLEYRIQKSDCLNAGIEHAQAGDQLTFIGSWEAGLIQGQKNKKSFIHISKVSLHAISPLPVIQYWWWSRFLTQLHRQIVTVYQLTLPEPEASLIAGVVIGDQNSLPSDFQTALKQAGLMHVVAASGYNVIVVIGTVTAISLAWFGRRWGNICALLCVIFYVGLAGGSPPVVRAGIMGILMLISINIGRVYWSLWSLCVTIWLMLVCSPWLLTSVSFQLTVAATVGLMVFEHPIEAGLHRIQPASANKTNEQPINEQIPNHIFNYLRKKIVSSLRESGITTLTATIATIPLQLVHFGSASILGLIINPLVLWLVPPMMNLGMTQAVAGIVWLPAAEIIGWTTYAVTHLFVVIVTWTSKITFGYYSLTANWWMAVGWWLIWLGLTQSIYLRTHHP